MSFVASFHDNDGNNDPGAYSVNINWGDQTSSAGTVVSLGNGNFNVTGEHTYPADGQYPINVQINDTDGDSLPAVTPGPTATTVRPSVVNPSAS